MQVKQQQMSERVERKTLTKDHRLDYVFAPHDSELDEGVSARLSTSDQIRLAVDLRRLKHLEYFGQKSQLCIELKTKEIEKMVKLAAQEREDFYKKDYKSYTF